MDTWKIFKYLAIYCAKFSVLIILIVMLNVIYYKSFSRRAVQKQYWDARVSLFLRKYHAALGMISFLLIMFHGIFFMIYKKIVKHDDYIIAGYLSLMAFIISAILGVVMVWIKKTQFNVQLFQKVRKWHIIASSIMLVLFFFHLYELEYHHQHKKKKQNINKKVG